MMFPIVFSVSDFYVPYFAVCLQSFQEHIGSENQYRVIVLQKGIDEENKQKLQSMIFKKNIQLDFYDIRSLIQKKHFHPHDHVSDETFFKLYIPQMFSKYKKVLFCDSDILFQDDPAKLFQINMKNKKIAAAPCHLWHGIIQNNTEAYNYTVNQLGIKDLDSYFQAGVILFQPAYITQKDIKKAIDLSETREFLCMDQDVLNAVFQDDLYIFDSRWNYEVSQPGFRQNSIPFMNETHKKEWESAGKNPAVIHYSGKEKPWASSMEEEYVERWWQTAKNTPFYQILKIRFDCSQIVNQEMQQLRNEFIKYHFPYINNAFSALVVRLNRGKVLFFEYIYRLKWIVLRHQKDKKKYKNLKHSLKSAKTVQKSFFNQIKKNGF